MMCSKGKGTSWSKALPAIQSITASYALFNCVTSRMSASLYNDLYHSSHC